MRDFSDNSPRPSRRQQGFGLLESLICLGIMSLLFLGAMDLIVSAGRGTVRTQAQVYSTNDAANSIQKIISQLRESSAFSLPTTNVAGTAETGTFPWTTPGGTALTQFSTTMPNGEIINSAIEVIGSPVMTTAEDGYTASVSNIRVLSTTGGYWAASGANWPVGPYNVQVPGSLARGGVVLYYRGDPDGTPDANPSGNAKLNAGTYLWQYTLPADSSFNIALHPPVAICKSISTAPDAVQFVRPVYNNVAEQNQLEVKLISSYYSPINGQQTSEEGNGSSSSQLSGKCVFMRDHYTGSITGTTGTRSSNNAFQYY